ncbi:hypothetical protein [Amycolatopsis sp. H20-H5]|uniref:hypothetical protein n=1 Tax=Amycolatopsis sp. H20-H5 TaxID=3046309 RepID=UPI002DB77FB2|nr:hypothetical protein [Amycolatopsis sp. H20-H5]MEC3975826.1 hypothetical protein [Amycolatopsis sp. H20-H5]
MAAKPITGEAELMVTTAISANGPIARKQYGSGNPISGRLLIIVIISLAGRHLFVMTSEISPLHDAIIVHNSDATYNTHRWSTLRPGVPGSLVGSNEVDGENR